MSASRESPDARSARSGTSACGRTKPSRELGLLPGDIEVGQRAFEGLRREGHGFGQRRVGVHGEADVRRRRAHLDRERDFRDEVPRIRADDAAADDAMRVGIEQKLRAERSS